MNTIQSAMAKAGLVSKEKATKTQKVLSILKRIDNQLNQYYSHALRFERQIVNLENRKHQIEGSI